MVKLVARVLRVCWPEAAVLGIPYDADFASSDFSKEVKAIKRETWVYIRQHQMSKDDKTGVRKLDSATNLLT